MVRNHRNPFQQNYISMKLSFEIKATFSVKPAALYHAWLDSELHSAMTGGEAICSDQADGEFSAWDGYIRGHNKSLKTNKEIVQRWRTSDFKDGDEDSELVIKIQEIEGGCELTLMHSNIPEGQPDYQKGWIDHYLEPMKEYFKK